MRTSELNPILGYTEKMGHQLSLNCPYCGERFSIYVNYQGEPKGPATWGLTHLIDNFDWNTVTLTPSISNHPLAKGRVCSQPHFSIINGEVIP